MFGASAMIGFGQGFQHFCGFNYGAGLYSRVKKGFFFSVKVSAGFLLVVSVTVFSLAPTMIGWFRDSQAVIDFGTVALRLQCITFPLQSWIVMSNMMQQVMGKTGSATFLAIARQGIFFIPGVLLLPLAFGALGIQMNQMVADTLTMICAIFLQLRVLKQLPKSDKVL